MKQIGFVSSHYRYTEEYVLGHTPDWVKRKYEQALLEKYVSSRERTLESYKGLMLLADSLFNKGKGFDDIVPSFEKLTKKEVETKQEEFVGGNWWESE